MFLPGESQGREAWWAVIYGVAQSRTRLKRLSSSSSIRVVCASSLISKTLITDKTIPFSSDLHVFSLLYFLIYSAF